jgi:hypothetical protein
MGTLRCEKQAWSFTDEVEQIGGELCGDFRL